MKKIGSSAVLVGAGAALTACAVWGEQVEILQAYAKSEHVLGLSLAACDSELESAVDETPTQIVVTVTAFGASENDCAQGLEIELEEPLATREVVDGSTDQIIELHQQPT